MDEQHFTIQVVDDVDMYALNLMSATGRIVMSRRYHTLHQAEDERDYIVAAWGQLPLKAMPTLATDPTN